MTDVHAPRPSSLPDASARLVVVEASAGTGKTYFLEHRVVDLILAGAELGQILLVTFTEKAVAELRLRIRDVLDRMARLQPGAAAPDPSRPHWVIDDDARLRLRAAVSAFDQAQIFTIHGYCHRILVEDAFAASRMFDQTQVTDEVAFDAAFEALLRQRFARDQPDRDLLAAYLESNHTVDQLRGLLLSCARADARVRRHHDPDVVRAAAVALDAALGTNEHRHALLGSLANGNDRRWAGGWLDQIGAALAGDVATLPVPQLVALLDRAREPLTKLHDKLDKLGGHDPLVGVLRDALGTVSLAEALVAELLPPIEERIGRDKAERGLFDYDDMLALVWEALNGARGADLAARLRARTPWAMIDEFQDTDPVQWGIFRTIWMHAEARGLTIVGDPKQAIYGFRGADVATYLAARDEMVRAGATRVALDVNRRSTEPLVEAINQLLVGNLAMPLLDGDITYDTPVKACGDITTTDDQPPVCALQLAAKGPTVDAARAALATAIGDAIEQLSAAPPAWSVRGAAQPFRLGQVLVLTRANRESAEIAATLRARGLPCALVEPERLFKTREASELASVMSAIAAPRDRSARLRALRTRFFDVPWAELARVVDGPDHHPHIARLFEWSQLASRRAYEALFRRIVEDSHYAERALVLGGGQRAVTNTWHLIELLLEEVARARGDLHELAAQLRRWIVDDAGQPDERDVQRAETDDDAIRVLTIHKAKGLEAPYVFLYGGLTGIPPSSVHTLRDATGRALVLGTPDPETKARLEHDAEAENQRLAYVGITRAQVRLYLPLYAPDQLNRNAGYGPLQRCLAASVHGRASHERALFDVRPVALEPPLVPPAPADALAQLVVPPLPPLVELAPIAPARAGLTMVSYTRLAHDLDAAVLAAGPGDVLAIDPAEFDVDDTVGEVPVNNLPPGAGSGLLLHDLLEVVDLERARRAANLAAWAADPVVRAQLVEHARRRGIAERFLPHAAEIVHRTLTAPLPAHDGTTWDPLVAATALAREVEFSYPLPPPQRRGLVRGFIDALVAYDDELWVLDYKSDLLAGGGDTTGGELAKAAELRVRERYAVQARLYAIAADRLRGPRRLAGLLFAFVRHDLVVPVRVAAGAVDAWTGWLAALPLEGRA